MPRLRSVAYTVRPLQWDGPRTPAAARVSTFSAAWTSTLNLLDLELFKLSASNVVMQLDVAEKDLRLDGELRANARPGDPAVRLLFDSRHGPLGYACDRFRSWQENVRAIALGLEALRKIDRYGIGSGQQYKGYRAIEGAPAAMTVAEAEQVLQSMGGGPIAPYAKLLRRARAAAHPDRWGGDRTHWDRAEQAARVLGLDR